MSDPTVGVNVEVNVIARIEQALASIRQLSRAAVADSGMPTDDRARAIAAEIALTRQLRDEEERALRGGGSISRRPAVGSQAASVRNTADSEIKELYRDLTTGLDTATKSAVADMVRTKRQQQSYYRQLDSDAGRAAAPGLAEKAAVAANAPPSAKEELRDRSRAAEAELASQRYARIGEGSEEFQATLAELDAENKRFSAVMSRLRRRFEDEFGSYVDAAAEAAVEIRAQTAAVEGVARADQLYIESTVKLAASRRRLNEETILGLHGETVGDRTPQQVTDRAAELARLSGLQDRTRQTAATSPEEIAARAANQTAEAERTAAIQEEINETTAMAAAKSRGRLATSELTSAQLTETAETEGAIEILAAERAARAQEAGAIKRLNAEASLRGDYGGSLRQRAAAFSSGSGAPEAQQTGLQAVVGRALSSSTSLVSGFASGALLFGLINAVKEATKLQESFAVLRDMLDNLGDGQQFNQMKEGIKGISNETGIASSKVAEFSERILGISGDPMQALAETESAMQLAVVSGADLKTLMTSLEPVSRAFGLSIQSIGDALVSAHDKYGVAEKDTTEFLSITAATAKEAGYSFSSLVPIGAAAANSLGTSMSSAGQQFARVIDQMQGNFQQIVSIYRSSPGGAKFADQLLGQFSEGKGSEAFKTILGSFNQLTQGQQQALVSVSGSRREWALLNGLWSKSPELLGQITQAENGTDGATGSLQKRFDEVSGTITQTIDRIKELVTNLAEGLATSGLGASFGLIIKGFEQVLTVGNLVMTMFANLNNFLKIPGTDQGFLSLLLAIGSTYFVLSAGLNALNWAKSTASRITTVATGIETAYAGATSEAAVAAGAEAGAVDVDTASKIANTGATEAGIAAKAAGLLRRLVGVGVAPGTAGAAGVAGEGVVSGILPGAAIGAGPILAGVASGLLSSNWARNQFLEGSKSGLGGAITGGGPGLTQLEDEMKARIHQQNSADLAKLASDQRTAWTRGLDRIQEAWFDVDLPTEAASLEESARIATPGKETVDKLVSTGKLGDFSKNVSQANRDRVKAYLSKDVKGGKTFTDLARKYDLVKQGDDGKWDVDLSDKSIEGLLPKLRKDVEDGDPATRQGAAMLLDYFDQVYKVQGSMKEVRDAVESAAHGGNVQEAIDKAGGIDKYLNTAFDLKGQLDTGQITPAQYMSSVEHAIADQRTALSAAKDPEAAYKALDAKIKEAQELRAKWYGDRITAMAKQAAQQSDAPEADTLKLDIDALSATYLDAGTNQIVPVYNLPQQLEQLPKLQDQARKAFEEHLDTIKDPGQRLAEALKGVPVNPLVQSLDVQQQLGQSAPWQDVMQSLSAQEGVNAQDFTKQVVDEAAKEGVTVREYLIEQVKARQAYAKLITGRDGTDPEADRLLKLLESAPDVKPEDIVKNKKQAEDIRAERNTLKGTLADINVAKAQYGAQGARRQAQLDVQAANEKLAELNRESEIGGPDAPTPDQIREAEAGVATANKNAANVADDFSEAVLGWATVNDFGDTVKQANDKLAEQNQKTADVWKHVGGDLTDPALVRSLSDQRQSQIDVLKANQAHTQLLLDWGAINANGDPMAEAVSKRSKAQQALADAISNANGNMNADQVIKAQQDLVQADQEVQKDQEAIDDSRYAVLLAKASRDPLQAALLSQRRAHEAAARAKGTAAQNNADAAAIAADRSVEDALSAGIEARANLAIALANVAGDPVKAAKIAMEEAKRKLDEVVGQGVTDPKVLAPFQGTLATATENYFRTGRSQEEKITDFQLQMGQITTQAAIESLRLILSRTREGTDEYMSLAQKIHGLEQQAGQDLQYNLPSDIGLPTLYESRRVAQSTMAGMGYQDNRNIVLSVNVNGAQDPMAVTNQIMSAFSAAVGSGNTYAPLTSGVNW